MFMNNDDVTVQEVYESFTPIQKRCLHIIVGIAMKHGHEHALIATDEFDEIYCTFDGQQVRVLWFLVDGAVKQGKSTS